MCMELQDQKEMIWEQFQEMAYEDDVAYALSKIMEPDEYYLFCKDDHWEHIEGIFEILMEWDYEGLCLDMKGTILRYAEKS